MYRPPCHRLDDRTALSDLIAAHPLGSWICLGTEGLVARHRPFALDRTAGPHGLLRSLVGPEDTDDLHTVEDGTPSLIVFHGPQTYITPGWYPGKAAHGRVVPTWNYAVVHAHGTVRWMSGRSGLEIPILRLEGKLKASQDETRPDREGTVAGLNALGTDAAHTMAALVHQALNTPPD